METFNVARTRQPSMLRNSPPSPEGELMETLLSLLLEEEEEVSPPSPEGELMETLRLVPVSKLSETHRLRLKEN